MENVRNWSVERLAGQVVHDRLTFGVVTGHTDGGRFSLDASDVDTPAVREWERRCMEARG